MQYMTEILGRYIRREREILREIERGRYERDRKRIGENGESHYKGLKCLSVEF